MLSRTTGRRTLLTLATAIVATLLVQSGRGARPRFFPDDPIQADNDRAFDASKAVNFEGSNTYDFAEQSFATQGERRDVRALNVNTTDEVPDSSWFTNRVGVTSMSAEEIARGPNQLPTLNIDGWPITQQKSAGVTPGFRMKDPSGHIYQLKFDPPENPEMSSGAEVIGAAIYHALGYNVVQGYIVDLDPEKIVLDPKATMVDMSGNKRPMTRHDVDDILKHAAKGKNGKYRALTSRFADGRPAGYFKYYGTRSDDPNDIFLHEHRRELRGNRVFSAWLNHDDSRALNSLDMVEGPDGKQWIKHYMFDFGSILGSGSTVPQAPRGGNEYLLEWKPGLLTLATLGLYFRPWITIDYPDLPPSLGRIEAERFDAVKWKPAYPNPAFDNMRPDDAFWAARLVTKFTDEAIRAIVKKAQFSDPRADGLLSDIMIKRRDKVVKAWLTGVNPVVNPRLSADGTLTFENAAVAAGVATAPTEYVLTWSRFDNAANAAVGRTEQLTIRETRAQAPPSILQDSAFVTVSVAAHHPDHPDWSRPVRLYFRRVAGSWQTVGLERE